MAGVGALLLFAGLWLIHPAAALVTTGGGLLAGGILGARGYVHKHRPGR